MDFLIEIIICIPIALIALTFHEVAHGFIAKILGDPTAKYSGRLSLNPIRHIDPIGAVCMVIFGFGWARAVPINPGYFKHPKRDMAFTALAGPITNLLLAFVGSFVYVLSYNLIKDAGFANEFTYNIAYYWILFTYLFVSLNVSLAVFNLIPIPPLDGSRVLFAFLPQRTYFKAMRYEREISIAFFILLFVDSRFLQGTITEFLLAPVNLIVDGMVSLFSLMF